MDSGNSGSMQSSSGGDDQEFHSSRASDSISSFLNPQNTFTPQQNFQFFNPQTLDHNSFPLTSHYNTNPSNDQLINWSSSATTTTGTTTTTTTTNSNLRSHSQQNYTSFANLTTIPSSSSTNPILPTTTTTQTGPFSNPRVEPEPQSYRAGPDQQLSNVIKNPKKRTRASRRAPTTVLTTDTTNFRQMVQEFTGIPAVPFSGSPYGRRLDLFSSGLRPDSFGPMYPLRPAAQKFNSTNISTPMFANTNTNTTSLLDSSTNTNNSNSQNYSLASADQLLNQFHHQVQQNQNITLQNLMSGYPSQERADSGQVVRNNDGNNSHSNNNRWRNDGVQENNMVVQQFDGNAAGNENVHVTYNLNVVSEKNVGEQQGNVNAAASWICNSD